MNEGGIVSRADSHAQDLFEVRGLSRVFSSAGRAVFRTGGRSRRPVHAVRDVSFTIRVGETLGLVGESGCGKSTTGRLLLGLDRPSAGEVLYKGRILADSPASEMRAFRRKAQIVFQDPFGSLNPRITVGRALREVLSVHRLARGEAAAARVSELLELVGLSRDAERRYPHEFSGGQRQRIGIARALCVQPEFLLADEPVSALDVSVQAQVLNLLTDLQERLNLTYLFIAHDLSVVRLMSDRVIVMYLGRIVESAPTHVLFEEPGHPYTQALMAAVPRMQRKAGSARRPEAILLRGDVMADPGAHVGCPFYGRCFHPKRDASCQADVPALRRVGPDHEVRCVKV